MQAIHAYTLPPDKLIQAVNYAHARHLLYFAGFAFSALILLAIIRLRIGPRLRHIPAPAFYAMILLLIAVLNLPVDVAGHAISLHFGISIQHWLSWLWDWVKAQAIGTAIGVLLALGFYVVLRRSPRRWWIWAWLATLPVLVAGAFAGPLIFEPLFNKFAPLSTTHPELVAEIEKLLNRAGVVIPPDHIYEMSASEKTNALNAYVSGFGPSRRVVLYDTIIRKEANPDAGPLMTTVGHELGHYVLGHISKGLAFGAAGLLIGFLIASRTASTVVRQWGGRLEIQGLADRASLPVFLIIALVLGFAAEPIGNGYSRWQEHQADAYSIEVTHGVIPDPGQAAARAFQIEGETNLDEPDPDPFIVFWLYGHPPTSDRLRFSLEYDPWSPGRQPEFVR
jgi:Zn-dependent protease with chaperone function